ncbi:XRE family transcriptional regulator [Afipia sp. P52-10]|uniref:helix-turn-helix domain-containing protein n=1 Tax=Afipia sp. P52-10 TaxID=1429916 RepID=UPI0003DF23D0|nr:helix-turn-helix domain-containing protein [Afipia sp. P52-10]ETR75503.1 XRE family transcriptional regulator [Afipia sp. P52-10]
MLRLRLKADGRIVEIQDGHEAPLAPAIPPGADLTTPALDVRALRSRSQLTQVEFAARLGVPLETIRNWEQGKREPRGPARALLTLIARAPDLTFALLAKASSAH